MFDEYTKAFRVRILNFMDIINVRKGEVMIVEGRPAMNIYFIIEGQFETTKQLLIYKEKGICTLEPKINVSYHTT